MIPDTRADRPVRHPLPDRADRHGLGGRARGWSAAAGGAAALGILASATMTLDRAARGRSARSRPGPTRPFGVNLRADAPDAGERVELIIAEGVRVASFALAPRPELIAGCKDAGVVVIASVGARRHAEKVAAWGADAVIVQGGEGGGHTGAVPTTLLLPQVVDAVDIPVIAAGGFFDGRGPGRRAGLRRGRDRDGHPVPAHQRQPGRRTRSSRSTWPAT